MQGNGATMLHRLPYSAINFWAYERITELWNRRYPAVTRGGKSHNYSLDVTRRLMAGGAAGMCACTVVRTMRLSDLPRMYSAAVGGSGLLGRYEKRFVKVWPGDVSPYCPVASSNRKLAHCALKNQVG